jgi:hypothetical protein
MAPVPAMAPMTATPMTATVHAVSATVATMTTSRSGGDSGSGKRECGDNCERDFTKHICILHLRGVIAS